MENLVNLGKILSKAEKKSITGGKMVCCYDYPECPAYNTVSCIIYAGECHYFPNGGGLSC